MGGHIQCKIMNFILDNKRWTPKLQLSVVLLVFISIILSVISINTKARSADTGDGQNKLVNIYDQGSKVSVISDGSKVEDAVKKSGIKLNEHDRVEPALDSEILSSEYNINIYRARPVIVEDGLVKKPVISAYQTGDEIVKDAGIEIRDEDIINLKKSDELKDGVGLKAVIKRATPFSLNFFGKTDTAYTQKKTVEEFLKEKDIKLGEDEKMSLAPTDPIVAGMMLKIWREGRQTITIEEDIAFSVEKIQNTEKDPGFREIRQPGKKGKRTATYDIIIENGEEVSRTEVASVITTPPTKQIEVHGTRFNYTGGPLTEAQINALGSCESGMTATRNSGNGFYGAFQFMKSTWSSVAPAPYKSVTPDQAPLEAQKQAVQNLLSGSNIFNQFPGCAKKMRANGIL